MRNFVKKQNGITLIALVVTIIVLIILAGVSIAMLVGENGIITQAQRAAQETEIRGDEEKIRLAMAAAQIANNGNTALKDDIEIALLENGVKSIVVDKEDGTRNIIFLDSKKIYKLNDDGSIKDTNSDFDSIYVAPDSQDEARNEGVIGIGTDGQPVDMDLWEYTLLDDGTYGLNDEDSLSEEERTRTSGYNNSNIVNGKIQGAIPQYIKGKNDTEFKAVTNLAYLFYNTDLSGTLVIPSTVTNMRATFNTTKIVKMPEIPNRVTNMYGTFAGCTNLTEVTVIPDSVTNMFGTFNTCNSLRNSPVLSKNVINLALTFVGCTSLVDAPIIPDKVTNMYLTFEGCTSLVKAPSIPDSVINMYSTFRGCTSLITAPIIPNSVKVLVATFKGCSNLQGSIEINANVTGEQLGEEFYNNTDYYNCLLDATTNSGITLKVTGTCSVLQEIVDNANNPNISLE